MRTRCTRRIAVSIAAVTLALGVAAATAMAVSAPPKWAGDVVAKPAGKTASPLMSKADAATSAPRDETRPRVRAAYENAIAVANADRTNCGVRYAVLAAVGSVESSIGKPTNRTYIRDGDGRVEPPIFGVTLSGSDGNAEVVDSDEGFYDDDPDWDRAVGPMQFLPSTWYRIKADANGDGTKDPQSIDDAALGALHYLCLAIKGAPIDEGDNLAVALFSYNRSKSYVARVIDIIDHLEGR
jgi:membrane-bound lytic murein transglycosylase B